MAGLSGCSSKSHTQADCDAIANQIRSDAADAGKGAAVCASTDPDTQKQFGARCQELKQCQDDCCK